MPGFPKEFRMLQTLRQYRRHLAGSCATLFAGLWLALALAPCVAMAGMDDNSGGHHHAAVEAEPHCPHCDQVDVPCADASAPDCGLPSTLAAVEPEIKLQKPAALPANAPAAVVLPPPLFRPEMRPGAPPHPPYTQLFCRFRE